MKKEKKRNIKNKFCDVFIIIQTESKRMLHFLAHKKRMSIYFILFIFWVIAKKRQFFIQSHVEWVLGVKKMDYVP